MKRFLCKMAAVLSLFALVSCSSTGRGEKKVYKVNNVPKILNAGFSHQIEEDKVSPVKQVNKGESVYMFVAVKDSGFDVSRIEVTASHDGGEEDTQIINMNKIDGEEFIYGVDVSFKASGEWKFCFYVFDEDENQSEAFRTSLTVL